MSDTPVRDAALKEGISTTSSPSTPTDANVAAPSTVKTEVPQTTQAASPANNSPATPEIDLHKNPRFAEVYNANKEMKRQLKELQRKMEEERQDRIPQKPVQTLSPEDEAAVSKLKSLLGLEGIDLNSLKSEINSIRQGSSERIFHSEVGSVASKASEMGLDKNEVTEALYEAFENHPVYSKLPYHEGIVKSVFSDLYFDKIGEIKEREINRRLIEEQNKKKLANTEGATGANAPPSSARKDGESRYDHMMRRVKESGGISFG